MDVFVRSLTGETQYISTQDRFCSMVPATAEHYDQMTSFRMAYLCREDEESFLPSGVLPEQPSSDILKRTTQMEDFKKEFVRSGLDQDPSIFDGSRIMLLKNGYASVDPSGARLSLDPSAPSRFEHRNILSLIHI